MNRYKNPPITTTTLEFPIPLLFIFHSWSIFMELCITGNRTPLCWIESNLGFLIFLCHFGETMRIFMYMEKCWIKKKIKIRKKSATNIFFWLLLARIASTTNTESQSNKTTKQQRSRATNTWLVEGRLMTMELFPP